MLMGLMSVAGVFALVLASLLSLRVASRRPLIIIPGVVIGFAAFGTFLLADTPAVYLAVIALGLATWVYMPALMTLPMELYADDPARVSVIFAFLVGTSGVAMFVSPVTVGALFDITGSFVPGLALFAIVSWGLAIAGFLLP
jgi:cyanate permease